MTRMPRLSQVLNGFGTVRRALAELVLPPICAGCNKDLESPSDVSLCLACLRAFTHSAEAICPRCAAPAPPAAIHSSGCLHCQETQFRFSQIASLGVYHGLLESFVLRMKQQSGESLALAAGRLLGRRILELGWTDQPEIVVPAPMHWTRRMWRGTNAPATLAEALVKELNLPLAPDLLRSVRNVPRQASLTPARRRRNMKRAFQASASYSIADRHVLVIDDVLTTGATANALAQPLLDSGARKVSIAIVARGIGLD